MHLCIAEVQLNPAMVIINGWLSVFEQQVTNVDHVDVAAHLKLLGESLATIGARLHEHKVSKSCCMLTFQH